ncbi:T9SS type B sorting domain-containing protein [Flavobacterium sp. PLA-1-15]|uniref:T9SS type B sorting domain-containing protein n=1 Tax=Flavobacterium sp. PLA-1-15 TaxID=3380533 RepID=UPI003B814F65
MTKIVSNTLTLFLFFFVFAFSQKSFSQCFQIESILATACKPTSVPETEGYNEMVRFRVGPTNLNTSNLSVNWVAQSWQGLIQNTVTASKVAILNANIDTAGGCGDLIEPTGGVLPANAPVILVTSHLMDTNSNSFGALAEDTYIIFQNNPSTGQGHFTNYGTSGAIMRTFSMNFGGAGCSDTVTYNKTLLSDAIGDTILFTPSGTPTYVNYGCSAPVLPFSVDAGTAPASSCPGTTISLLGTAEGEQTVQWSAPSGTFSAATNLSTNYTIPAGATGNITVTLTVTNSCGDPLIDTVIINIGSANAPTFTLPSTLCSGATAPALPTTSNNGITGTWSPTAISNIADGTYVFTPTAGQCASTYTHTVTVGTSITPTFTLPTTICNGGTAPALPTTSDNGITGTWSPATINNTGNGNYTFTPTAGQCASNFILNVTVSTSITPTFTLANTYCNGATVPALPTTSDNGITGTWSPATINNTANGNYVFTPAAGQCASNFTLTVTITNNTTPTFTLANTYCNGAAVPALPTTSDNGITGTWSPATINNTANGNYVFTPAAGQCASNFTLTVTITNNTTPTFTLANTYCNGATVPALPTTSDNGITGTWSPATISNTANGNYVFTPTAGQCASNFTLTVTITNNTTPTFTLANTYCNGATVPALPTTSDNGITGTWSPATISNTANGNYVFTPTAGQCASTFTLTVTIQPSAATTTGFTYTTPVCGDSAPLMPNTVAGFTTGGTFTVNVAGLSINSSTGEINVAASTPGNYLVKYEVLATGCQSYGTTTAPIEIKSVVIPVVSFSYPTTICKSSTSVMIIPAAGFTPGGTFTSDTGLSINPATGEVNPSLSTPNPHSVIYTVPGDPANCVNPNTDSAIITFTPETTPAVSFTYPTNVCFNSAPVAPTTFPGTPGGTFSSDPGLSINPTTGQINVVASTAGPHIITYTVSQDNTICRAFGSDTFTITIDSAASVAPITGDDKLCVGETLQLANATPGGTWSSSDTSIATVDANGLVTGLVSNFVDIIYTLSTGCNPESRVTIAVYELPQPVLQDRYLCVSNVTGLPLNSVRIECGIPTMGHTFVWTRNGNPLPTTTNNHLATELGIYEVTVTNSVSGCSNTASCEVKASSSAVATATVEQDFNLNQTITVTVTEGSGDYLFQLNHGVPQESNIFTNVYQGEHTITVIDKNDCQDFELTVFALNYPRFFTPNGDGFNDTWGIKGLNDPNAKTYIFDRYGKLVKFLNANGEEWDGTLNGHQLPSTDYWFLLEYKNRDGLDKEFKAHFSMKR